MQQAGGLRTSSVWTNWLSTTSSACTDRHHCGGLPRGRRNAYRVGEEPGKTEFGGA